MIGTPGQRDEASQPEGPEASRRDASELFSSAFSRQRRSGDAGRRGQPRAGRELSFTAPAPPCPRSLIEAGLNLGQACDLTLKHAYLHGSLTGSDVARRLRLPFSVIEEALAFLRQTKCLEVLSGDLLGQVSYRFQLTDLGRIRAREAFETCRYVGPAPVPLSSYVHQCRRQALTGIRCDAASLAHAFEGLLVSPELLEGFGAALCDGQALFLHGPPGNGKTAMARRLGRFLHTSAGEIYVPYAIQADGAIITVFDPNVHQTTDDAELRESPVASDAEPPDAMHEAPDRRWRRIRRPVVVTAGELTLDMLDLRFQEKSRCYVAPSHMKSNGGVFLIDDFGRQRASPRDLLNRWILPLAERVDYLTLATGKKFAVPFEQLVIFSTNLEPAELVDDAFLRRIRHKLRVAPPAMHEYVELFRRACSERGVTCNLELIRSFFGSRYSSTRPPRWSDPQDLLEIIRSICRFRGTTTEVTDELLSAAARAFFCEQPQAHGPNSGSDGTAPSLLHGAPQ